MASAEPEPIVRTYLQQYGVNADKVTSGVAVATRPTPTLVLVDREGTVRGMWVGKQKPEAEREIVGRLNTLTTKSGS